MPANEIAMGAMQRDRCFEVRQLLAERICQPRKSARSLARPKELRALTVDPSSVSETLWFLWVGEPRRAPNQALLQLLQFQPRGFLQRAGSLRFLTAVLFGGFDIHSSFSVDIWIA